MTRRPPARVLIADDHALLRSGMRAMLAGEPGLEVVGEAADGGETVELCRELRPDLVLMDVGMPGMGGMEATRGIKAEHPAVSVLVVTAHPSPDYMLDAVRAGAAGYLLKTAGRDEVSAAIRSVLRNELPLDRQLTAHLIQRLAQDAPPSEEPLAAGHRAGSPDVLTARETEVPIHRVAVRSGSLAVGAGLSPRWRREGGAVPWPTGQGPRPYKPTEPAVRSLAPRPGEDQRI